MSAYCNVPVTNAKLMPNVCKVHQRMDKISHTSAYVGAIRCDVSTPLHQIFYVINIFEYCTGGLRFVYPLICQLHHVAFDRLISHVPFSSPAPLNVNVLLKFQCIFYCSNFLVTNLTAKSLI